MTVLSLLLILFIGIFSWYYLQTVNATSGSNGCQRTPKIGGVPGPKVEKEQFCALAVRVLKKI